MTIKEKITNLLNNVDGLNYSGLRIKGIKQGIEMVLEIIDLDDLDRLETLEQENKELKDIASKPVLQILEWEKDLLKLLWYQQYKKLIKAIEIMRNKKVNIHFLFLHTLEDYNILVCNAYQLTKQEYELIKEVLDYGKKEN